MQGYLRKMRAEPNVVVDYYLRLGESERHLNPYLGETIRLTWTGRISCSHCGRITSKSFGQGYCYPCFRKLAQCDLCITSPERCHYAAGTCRDEAFAQSFCMQPHIVYLANSSGIKVGITRPENLPSRWIDQGAVQALPVLAVQTRQQSGLIEVAFRQHVSDRTHWQKMLKSEAQAIDLKARRDELLSSVAAEIEARRRQFGIQAVQPIGAAKVQQFRYPVLEYPEKVVSLSFDKQARVEGRLLGIKAQYLILDTGVINLRKFTAYEVVFCPP